MKIEEILKSALSIYEIEHGELEIDRTLEYLEYILDYNKKINLVGTKEKREILIRHILDSLSISSIIKGLPDGIKILDIGTGAGFPGIPLSIFFKEIDYFLLESKKKALVFLAEIIKRLELANIELVNGRAEELAKKPEYRQKFDLVTSRAFSNISMNLEISLPYCKKQGLIVLYKGKKVFTEIEKITDLVNRLGGEEPKIQKVEVPFLDEFRALLTIRKVNDTLLKYPRKYGNIKKNKLV